jgi:hypothetical protein
MTGEHDMPGRPRPNRLLFVIARDRLRLHQSFMEMFSEEEDIGVIFDRRVRERRQAGGPAGAERRRADRRARLHVADELQTRGYAKVMIG